MEDVKMLVADGRDTGIYDITDTKIKSGDYVRVYSQDSNYSMLGMVFNNEKIVLKQDGFKLDMIFGPYEVTDYDISEEESSYFTIIPIENFDKAICECSEGKKNMLFFKKNSPIFKGSIDLCEYDEQGYLYEIM